MSEATKQAVDRLVQEARETSGVLDSVQTFVEGIPDIVRQTEPTAEAINALADELDRKVGAVLSAIEAKKHKGEKVDPPSEPPADTSAAPSDGTAEPTA